MFATIVIGVLVLAISTWLLVDSRRLPVDIDGLQWIRWGPGYRAAAIFGLLGVAVIVVDGVNEGRAAISITMASIFGLLVFPVAANGFLWRVGFDPSGLRCRSAWRKERIVLWSEISRVSFSMVMRQWVLHTKHQGLIRINELASGVDRLIDELRIQGIPIEDRPAQL